MDLTFMLAPLQGLLTTFQKERQYKEDGDQKAEVQRQEALQALYQALTATKLYIELHPDVMDREKELQLSNLWATAAIKCRPYSEDTVHWGMQKAVYWLSTVKWTEEDVKKAGIDLETVEAKIMELIQQQ